MRLLYSLVFLLFIRITAANSKVFQGSCSDSNLVCDQLCVTLNPETYECSCWNDHVLQADGFSCHLNIKFDDIPVHEPETTTAVEVEYIPDLEDDSNALKFRGNNYAEFPVVESAYLETNITIEFRIHGLRDGILFFAGQHDGDDFISVALIGPNIMLRQDCGEGTIEDLYRGPFQEDTWHNLTVMRKYCFKTEIRTDRKRAMVDYAKHFTNYKGITMDDGIFIGGAPSNFQPLEEMAGTSRGFSGCIRKVIVNEMTLLDTRNGINKATNAVSFDRCGGRGGEKTINEIAEDFLEFDLATGPEERQRKELRVNATTAAPSTSTWSRPPFTKTLLSSAHFSGDQSVMVDFGEEGTDFTDFAELVLHFKPIAQFGLIFFWESENRHLAVYLRKGYLTAEITMGADSVILRSESTITTDKWHKAEFWRTGRGLLLKVDHQSWVESELESTGSVTLRESGKIYIGGYEGALPGHLRGLSGFHGCLKHVRFNSRAVRIYSSESGIRACGSDPCAAAGCPNACSSYEDEYVCLCNWPTYGRHCTQVASKRLAAMNFDTHSYLEIRDEKHLNHITGDSLRLNIMFRLENTSTSDNSQLLAFAGDHAAQLTGDYLYAVVTREKNVMVSMNLGSGSVELSHPEQLRYDNWYTISVERDKKRVSVSVDRQNPISTVAPGSSEQLNVYSALYVGGLPFHSKLGGGFVGCIQNIDIGPNFIVNPSEVSTAVNIRDCSI